MTLLGQRIRELREKRDLSLRELARSLDLSAAYLSDVELGRRYPTDEMLSRIAKRLHVPVDELRALDSRAPVDDLKRIAASNPTYGFALRRIVDGIADEGLGADDLLAMIEAGLKKNRK